MSVILTLDDFKTGYYRISLGTKQPITLQEVMDQVEAKYIPELFGAELSALFLADLVGGVPQTQRFIDVFNPFTVQDTTIFYPGRIYTSEGIKTLLKGLVYFLYVRDTHSRVTDNGPKITRSENSEDPRGQLHDIHRRWNLSVQSWRAIQYRMDCEEPATYPEFEGLPLKTAKRF